MKFQLKLTALILAGASLVFNGCSKPSDDSSRPEEEKQVSVSEASERSAMARKIWEPSEWFELQRALLLVNYGDVIHLGPGEFDPFWTPIRVVFAGAGVDETAFVYRQDNYYSEIDLPNGGGVAGLRDLSVRAEEGMTREEWRGAYRAVFIAGEAVVSNVRVGPWVGTGLYLMDGKFTVDGLTLVDCQYHGLSVFNTNGESVFDGITASGSGEEAFDLEVGNFSAGTFRNLALSGDGAGAIVVSGAYTAPVFEGLDSFTRNDILYEDGAIPEGVTPDEIAAGYEEYEFGESIRSYHQGYLIIEAADSSPERRRLAVEYFARAPSDATVEAASAALVDYVIGLAGTGRDDIVQPYIRQALGFEFDWFVKRFGLEAMQAILFRFPPHNGSYDGEWGYYARLLSDEDLADKLWTFADNPPPEEPSPSSGPVLTYEARMKAAFGDVASVAEKGDAAAVGAAFSQAIESAFAVRKSMASGAEKNASGKLLESVIQKAFEELSAVADANALVEALALVPTVSSRDGMPARRELLRGLSDDQRRAVMLGLRGR